MNDLPNTSGTVLFVDNSAFALDSVEHLLSDTDMTFMRAAHANDALDIINRKDVSVIVSDDHIPGMKGSEFFSVVKEISPATVNVMMVSYADLPNAFDAIYKEDVYRFIVKPFDTRALVRTMREALHHHQYKKALDQINEPVLLSVAQDIELKDIYTRGHCERVAGYALMAAEALGLIGETKKFIEYGSWLHDCGKVNVPKHILNHNGSLNYENFETVKNHPVWGADIAKYAQLPEKIIDIILYHHERYDGNGYPVGLKGNEIPLEAHIVSVADIFDALTTDRPYRKKYPVRTAVNLMLSMRGNILSPELVDIFVYDCLKYFK